MQQFSPQTDACIRSLMDCHTMCHAMAMVHCLELGGAHARPQHLRLMLDCASFCLQTADMLSRKSQFHNAVCALAADITETCGEDCARLGQMDDCAALCHRTAELCRTVAKLDHAEVLAMASKLVPE